VAKFLKRCTLLTSMYMGGQWHIQNFSFAGLNLRLHIIFFYFENYVSKIMLEAQNNSLQLHLYTYKCKNMFHDSITVSYILVFLMLFIYFSKF
jgi:hypothetical protein